MDNKQLTLNISDQIFNKMLENTYTLHQLNRRIRLLKQILSDKIYHPDTPQKALGTITSQQSDINWYKQLSTEFLNLFNQKNLTEIFTSLETTAQSQKPALIYTAIELPDDEIDKLGVYLRQSYEERFLFDLKIDPSLIAGCSIVYNGLFKDYSLRKKLETNKEAILKEIQGFLNNH